jgi:hypothetical protein
MSEPKTSTPVSRRRLLARYAIVDTIKDAIEYGSFEGKNFIRSGSSFNKLGLNVSERLKRLDHGLTHNRCELTTRYQSEERVVTRYIEKNSKDVVLTTEAKPRYIPHVDKWYLADTQDCEQVLCVLDYGSGNATTNLSSRLNHVFDVGVFISPEGNVHNKWIDACNNTVLVTNQRNLQNINLDKFDIVVVLLNVGESLAYSGFCTPNFKTITTEVMDVSFSLFQETVALGLTTWWARFNFDPHGIQDVLDYAQHIAGQACRGAYSEALMAYLNRKQINVT